MQTTFGSVLKWIERPFQTTVERDRAFLVDMANRIREEMYNAYQEFELEVDVTECFQLQKFCQCGQCDHAYLGVTLPSYMQAVEQAWFLREPITLYSSWREGKVGIKTTCDCALSSYDQPGFYPTERDMAPCGCVDSIQFLAKSPLDNNKIVRITYEDQSGEQQSEEVALKSGAWMPITGMAKYIKNIILPTNLKAGVDVRQANGGRVLSSYAPTETVPSYRRIKLTGVCENATVVIKASRKFTPLYEDHDIAEIDNRPAFEEGARYLFYNNSGPETALIQKAEYHRQKFLQQLKGQQSRDMGINRENATSSQGPPVRRSRLFSNRKTFLRR